MHSRGVVAWSRTRRAVRLQRREPTSQQNLAVRLKHEAVDDVACIRIKGRVETAVSVQPRHSIAASGGCSTVRLKSVELAPEDDLSVRLHRQAIDDIICIGIKGGIDRAIGVQPGDVVARLASNGGEPSSHDDLTVGLHGHTIDAAVGIGIEPRVHRTVRMEPHEMVAGVAADREKVAPHQDFAIRLHRRGDDSCIGGEICVQAVHVARRSVTASNSKSVRILIRIAVRNADGGVVVAKGAGAEGDFKGGTA